MTEPDDEFDFDAFDSAFAAHFGEALAEEPSSASGAEHEGEDDAVDEAADLEPVSVIAVVLTPVADPEVLARLMGMVQLTWPVFGTRTGAVAAETLPSDDVSQLTGQAPAEAIQVAKALSRTSEFGIVLLTSRVGQGEDGATGQIQAVRYVAGKETETLAPGVVLAGVDESVERVLFGAIKPVDIPHVLDPAEVASRPPPKTPPKRRWGRKP